MPNVSSVFLLKTKNAVGSILTSFTRVIKYSGNVVLRLNPGNEVEVDIGEQTVNQFLLYEDWISVGNNGLYGWTIGNHDAGDDNGYTGRWGVLRLTNVSDPVRQLNFVYIPDFIKTDGGVYTFRSLLRLEQASVANPDFYVRVGVLRPQDGESLENDNADLREGVWFEYRTFPVRLLSDTNITLSGNQVIDGILTVDNDLVLVTGQTDPKENGLYVARSIGWFRPTGMNANADFTKYNNNLVHFVKEGNVHANQNWILTTQLPINLGVSNMMYAQSPTGARWSVNAKSGNGAGALKTLYTDQAPSEFGWDNLSFYNDNATNNINFTVNDGTPFVLINTQGGARPKFLAVQFFNLGTDGNDVSMLIDVISLQANLGR